MKKFLPLLTVVILIAIIISVFLSMSNQKKMVTIQEENHKHKPLDITLNHYQDTYCGMTIMSLEHSVQVIAPDGRTWFFDDIGCFSLWFKNIKFQDEATVWVYSNDTKQYIDAKKAFYNQTDSTPMGYGFGAHEHKVDGLLTFDEMLLKMYRGENLANPLIRKKLLGN